MAKAVTHPVEGKALFEVDTPKGRRPYIPPGPEPTDRPLSDDGSPLPDNPDNPRGKPSLSLPQQATPLTSKQGVMSAEDVAHLDDPEKVNEIMLQDGLAPDNPLNPKGSPDYILGEEAPPPPDAPARRREAEHG